MNSLQINKWWNDSTLHENNGVTGQMHGWVIRKEKKTTCIAVSNKFTPFTIL